MRKTTEVTIASGRDQGKKFLITEMAASQAEKWAFRALGAIAHGGVEIPENVLGAGMAGVAVVGLRALLSAPFAEAEPLLDEMMECVQSVQPAGTRRLVEDDIEDVRTRLLLREEALTLHTGFSIAAALSSAAAQASLVSTTDASPNTLTSAQPSESSSPVA